jgi:hypothetical protein
VLPLPPPSRRPTLHADETALNARRDAGDVCVLSWVPTADTDARRLVRGTPSVRRLASDCVDSA